MHFVAFAEVDLSVYDALFRVREYVEPHLNAAFASCSLTSLDVKIRYVPIVMPKDAAANYPARSKLRKAQKLYDCAPVLNNSTFQRGSFEAQIKEYVSGIEECAQYLEQLGATKEQIEQFDGILKNVVEYG